MAHGKTQNWEGLWRCRTNLWFYKQEYQHAVYNGDTVYYLGVSEYGQGYNNDNIKWYAIMTEDGFSGWLPAYILQPAR